MPPASLHHLTKASPTSKNSWPRPGATDEPVSAIVPTLMVVALMPRPLPPVALPVPQIPFRVPKSPGPAAVLDEELDEELEDGALLDGLVLPPPDDDERPQAASATNVVVATPTATSRVDRCTRPRLTAAPCAFGQLMGMEAARRPEAEVWCGS